MGSDEERKVATWYDTLSDSYDELYSKEQSAKHLTVLKFLRGKRFRTLVDIGSGTGGFLRRAEDVYDQGVGIDLSRNMLKIARKEKPAHVDLIVATLSMLPIKSGTVDCTISVSAAVADAEFPRTIREMERIGHPDSVKVFTILRPSNESTTLSLLRVAHSTKISDRETLYFLGPISRK